MNKPNRQLPKKNWSVYQWVRGREAIDRLQHIGEVMAVDYGTAQSDADSKYGKHAYDYIKPPTKEALDETKIIEGKREVDLY